jgi:hypothetical protein
VIFLSRKKKFFENHARTQITGLHAYEGLKQKDNYRILIELHTEINVWCRLHSYQDFPFIDDHPVEHYSLISHPKRYSQISVIKELKS